MNIEEIKDKYLEVYEKCEVLKSKEEELEAIVSKVITYRPYYEHIEKQTGVPWYVVACLHYRESSFNFSCNLANGEPLNRKTRLVPKGFGPWNTWEESAVWVLKDYKKLDKVTNWDLRECLWQCVKWNGLGYEKGYRGYKTRPLSGMSPYLCSYTNYYLSGKFKEVRVPPLVGPFVAIFDKNLADKQAGIIAIFKALFARGIL